MAAIGGSSSGGGTFGSFGSNPFSGSGGGTALDSDITTQAAAPHSGRSFRRAIKKQAAGGGNNLGGGANAGGSAGHPSSISRFAQGKGGPHIADTVRLDGGSKMYGSLGKLF